jgi:hypothetical protein
MSLVAGRENTFRLPKVIPPAVMSPHHEGTLCVIEDTSVLWNVLAVLRETKPIFS